MKSHDYFLLEYLFPATAARLANEHTEDNIMKYPITWQRVFGWKMKNMAILGMILGRQALVTFFQKLILPISTERLCKQRRVFALLKRCRI